MADSSLILDSCAIIGNGSISFGYGAAPSHLAAGTGGMFIGYQAGANSSSGSSAFAIGANSVLGTTSGDCIAIGSSASVSQGSAASKSIAIGASAVCTTLNTIVLGASTATGTTGPVIQESGRHQYFWTLTTASSSLVLSGITGAAAILGGWIAFETLTSSCTLTLPNLTDMLLVLPTLVEGSTGELIVSNFNSGGWTVTVNNGTDAYWYCTDPIAANTIHHAYFRYVATSGWQQSTPFIEFFS